MKPVFWVVSSIFGGLCSAQPHYIVTDLGALPGANFSQAAYVSDDRLVAGVSGSADGTQHAMLWGGPFRIDIGPAGLNSGAFGFNRLGQASIQAEVTAKDPNNENFCAYGTGRKCLPFVWQRGVLTQLATLGGNNGTVGNVNNPGQMVGIAENNVVDRKCPAGVSLSGTGPQVLDFQAVIWGPGFGEIHQLNPLPGDTVGMAVWINDSGQSVGATGTCANTVLPPLAFGPHAVLWDKDGTPRDLGNLGSTAVNMALSINNLGQVVGVSSPTDKSTPGSGVHAFLWTKEALMRDLGTLPGDVTSIGSSINDKGQVVGTSFDPDGNPRLYLWQNGAMYDLNSLVRGHSPLYLMFGGINSVGEIAGTGATDKGEIHAFLASPVGDR